MDSNLSLYAGFGLNVLGLGLPYAGAKMNKWLARLFIISGIGLIAYGAAKKLWPSTDFAFWVVFAVGILWLVWFLRESCPVPPAYPYNVLSNRVRARPSQGSGLQITNWTIKNCIAPNGLVLAKLAGGSKISVKNMKSDMVMQLVEADESSSAEFENIEMGKDVFNKPDQTKE